MKKTYTKEQTNAYNAYIEAKRLDPRARESDIQRVIANNLISQIFGCFKDGAYSFDRKSFDREIIEIDATSAGDLLFIHLDNGQTFSVKIEERSK